MSTLHNSREIEEMSTLHNSREIEEIEEEEWKTYIGSYGSHESKQQDCLEQFIEEDENKSYFTLEDYDDYIRSDNPYDHCDPYRDGLVDVDVDEDENDLHFLAFDCENETKSSQNNHDYVQFSRNEIAPPRQDPQYNVPPNSPNSPLLPDEICPLEPLEP